MARNSQVTKISFVSLRSPVASPTDRSTSSLHVSSDKTSIIRPCYAADDEHHIEQINIIPAAAGYSASMTYGDGFRQEGQDADEPVSRGRLRSFTSTSSTSDDGTTFIRNVTFRIGVEDPYITGQAASRPEVNFIENDTRFPDQRSSQPGSDLATGDDSVQLGVSNAKSPETAAAAEDELPVSVVRASRGQPDREKYLRVFGKDMDEIPPGRISRTSSLSSNSEVDSQLEEEDEKDEDDEEFGQNQSKPSTDNGTVDSYPEQVIDEDECALVQTRSAKKQSRHEDVSNALKSMEFLTNEGFSPHDRVAHFDGNHPNDEQRRYNVVKDVNEIPPGRRSSASSGSSDSRGNSPMEGEDKGEVKKDQSLRLCSKPSTDKETFYSHPEQSVVQKVEPSLMQTRSVDQQTRHENASNELNSIQLHTNDRFAPHEHVAHFDGKLLDGEESLRDVAKDVNEIPPGRHSSASSRSSDSEGKPLQEDEEDEVRNDQSLRLYSKPTADKEKSDSHPEQSFSHKDEPGLIEQDTRGATQQPRHEKVSNAFRSLELLTNERFISHDHSDGEQMDANESPRGRHSSTSSSSRYSGSDSQFDEEEETDDDTFHSDHEQNVSEKDEPVLVQTRGVKPQARHEEMSNALRSMELRNNEGFAPNYHVAISSGNQLDDGKCLRNTANNVIETPPRRHSNASSRSSDSEGKPPREEEGKEDVKKNPSLQLYSKPSTDKQTLYSDPEQGFCQKDEPALAEHETRRTKQQEASNGLIFVELLNPEEFTISHHGDHVHVAHSGGEELDAKKITPRRRSTASSASSNSGRMEGEKDNEEEVGKNNSLRLYSKPLTVTETFHSHPERSVSHRDQPDLVQHETSSSKDQSRREEVSNALKSTDLLTNEAFAPHDHVAHSDNDQLLEEKCLHNVAKDVNEIPPRRHSSASSRSSDSESKSPEDDEEDKEKVRKKQSLRSSEKSSETLVEGQSYNRPRDGGFSDELSSERKTPAQRREKVAENTRDDNLDVESRPELLCFKPVTDKEMFGSHPDPSVSQKDEPDSIQTRSIRHENVSNGLNSTELLTHERFTAHDRVTDFYGDQLDEEIGSRNVAKDVNEIPPGRHSSASSRSRDSEGIPLQEEEDQKEEVRNNHFLRLCSIPATDNETFDSHPVQSASQKDEPGSVEHETRGATQQPRHEKVSNAFRSLELLTNERFTSPDHSDGEQLDENKSSRGRHSNTSSSSRYSGSDSQFDEEEEDTDDDTFHSDHEQNVSEKNEPALMQTRGVKPLSRHEEVSNALRSMELRTNEGFASRDHVAISNGDQLDGEKCLFNMANNVNEIPPGKHSSASSRSSDSEGNKPQEEETEEVNKNPSLQLYSKPSTDKETFYAHREQSRPFSQKDEHVLMQSRSIKQQIRPEEASNGLRSVEHLIPDGDRVHVERSGEEQLNVNEIPPGRRSSASSRTSDTEVESPTEDEEDKDKVRKRQSLRSSEKSSETLVKGQSYNRPRDGGFSYKLSSERKTPAERREKVAENRRLSDDNLDVEHRPELLCTKPVADKEMFGSHPERSVSQKDEPGLMQTRSVRHENVSNGLNSTELPTNDRFTAHYRVADFYEDQLDEEKRLHNVTKDVNESPPGRHSSASSVSSGCGNDHELEDEEEARRVADVHQTNKGDESADSGRIAKSDPVAKQHQYSTSLIALHSRQPNDTEVLRKKETVSHSPTRDSFGGAWATQYKSQRSFSTEESPYVSSTHSDNWLFSVQTAQRPYFYTDDNQFGQSTGDRRVELPYKESSEAQHGLTMEAIPQSVVKFVPHEASNNAETSPQPAHTAEYQYAPSIDKEISVDTAPAVYETARPIVTHAGHTGAWNSSEKSSETLAEGQSYDRPRDGDFSDGLSTKPQTSTVRREKFAENTRLSDDNLDVERRPELYLPMHSAAAAAATVRVDDGDVRADRTSPHGSEVARPDRQSSLSDTAASRENSIRDEEQKRRSSKLWWLNDAAAAEDESISKVAADIWQMAGGKTTQQSHVERETLTSGELSVIHQLYKLCSYAYLKRAIF